jgi:hypothetical protein
MDYKLHIVFLLVGLLIFGCEKDELPEQSPDGMPVFTYDLTFNNQAYSFAAGQDGLALQPGFVLNDSVLVLESTLNDSSCTNCYPEFSMRIEAPEYFDFTTTENVRAMLGEWNYAINPSADTTEILNIAAISGQTEPPAGFWSLNGNGLNAAASPTTSFTVEQAGTFNLAFMPEDESCQIPPPLSLDYDGNTVPCYANFADYEQGADSAIFVTDGNFNLDSASYVWSAGDSTLSTSNGFFYVGFEPIYEEVCVEINTDGGCVIDQCINTSFASCNPNIRINSAELETEVLSIDSLAVVQFEFKDESGELYSSANGDVQSQAFQIMSVAPYSDPAFPDRKFARLELAFQCVLFNDAGMGAPFSGEIATAVELP